MPISSNFVELLAGKKNSFILVLLQLAYLLCLTGSILSRKYCAQSMNFYEQNKCVVGFFPPFRTVRLYNNLQRWDGMVTHGVAHCGLTSVHIHTYRQFRVFNLECDKSHKTRRKAMQSQGQHANHSQETKQSYIGEVHCTIPFHCFLDLTQAPIVPPGKLESQ